MSLLEGAHRQVRSVAAIRLDDRELFGIHPAAVEQLRLRRFCAQVRRLFVARSVDWLRTEPNANFSKANAIRNIAQLTALLKSFSPVHSYCNFFERFNGIRRHLKYTIWV